MRMMRCYVQLIAVGLLLAVSGPGFAAKRMSDTKHALNSQSRAGESGVSTIRSNGRDPYPYGRDDPYAPGVNWPGRW